MNIIGAIRIDTGVIASDRTDIGLYSGGASTAQLRWSEAALVGVTDTYCETMLLRNGIEGITESFDASVGGNSSLVNDFVFKCKGTNQLILRLSELGIDLYNAPVEYIEFSGTDADSDSDSETIMFTGTMESIDYNEYETVFTVKSSFEYKRNKQLSEIATSADYPEIDDGINGEIIPITFGRSDPSIEMFFKLTRLQYKNAVISNTDIMPNGRPDDMEIFPAVAANPTTDDTRKKIRFLIGEGLDSDDADKQLFDIESKYIKIESGSVASDGQIRSVMQWITDDITSTGEITYGPVAICVELDDVFSEWIPVYDSATQTYHAFCKILDLLFTFIMDSESSECLVSGNFYIKSGDLVQPIMDVDITQITSGIPSYRFEPRSFAGSESSIESLVSYPASSVIPYDSPTQDLLDFGIDGDYKQPYIVSPAGYAAGIFCEQNSGCFVSAQGVISGATYFNDKDRSTSWEFDATVEVTSGTDRHDYYLAFYIGLPVIPDDLEFDKVYLGLDLLTSPACSPVEAQEFIDLDNFILKKRYYDGLETVYDSSINNYDSTIRTLPDNYYTTPESTGNLYRFFANGGSTYAGLTNFDLDVSTVSDLRSIYKILVLFKVRMNTLAQANTIAHNIKFKEIAFVFSNSISLPSEIYA